MREAQVFRLPMADPGDVSAIAALLDAGTFQAEQVAAVIGKTEGNGGVNDFTRGYFTQSLMLLLSRHTGTDPSVLAGRIPCVLSGGTEGVLSPHYMVFVRRPAFQRESGTGGALAVGTAFGATLAPEALGRMGQLRDAAATVRAALEDAGMTADEVCLVQLKMPCLTAARMDEALACGVAPVTRDANRGMALARAAGALGAALALGEVDAARLEDTALLDAMHLYSERASVSSGVEVPRTEVVVLGHAAGWVGPLAISCRPMRDALDIAAVHAALAALGIQASPQVTAEDNARIRGVLAKGEPDRHGSVRGHRHTMLQDTDINAQRHLRGALGGVLAGILGDGRIFVSGGAEHQGPDGGGLVAVIAERG
jgi:cyanuric acid amidohydrolase